MTTAYLTEAHERRYHDRIIVIENLTPANQTWEEREKVKKEIEERRKEEQRIEQYLLDIERKKRYLIRTNQSTDECIHWRDINDSIKEYLDEVSLGYEGGYYD